MPEPQGVIFFDGVRDILEASYSLTHGISPGVATLVIPPQTLAPFLTGTLRIQQGPLQITFPRSRVDDVEQSIDGEGRELWTLRILDRRWLWRLCGQISGRYNTRRGTAVLSVKRPQELAKMCLEAMGETGYDVSLLPNESFPEIEWDYNNPAEALQSLCDGLNCRVVLTTKDRVKIVRAGEGAALVPNNRTLDGGKNLNPADPPGEIAIVTARTEWQLDMPLEPVGLHPDGSIVPIADLPYIPVVGGIKTWGYSTFEDFCEIRDERHRGLAQQSVFRWYQIRNVQVLGGTLTIKDRWRILPLLNRQVVTRNDPEKTPREPQVYGRFWAGGESHEPATKKPEPDLVKFPRGEWTDGFSLDSERGIVKLSSPAVIETFGLHTVPGVEKIYSRIVSPADLRLRCSVNLRDEKTRQFIRNEYRTKPPGKRADPSAVAYVIHEDAALKIRYDLTLGKWVDNRAEVEKVAKHYLEIERSRYQTLDGGAITQAGFVRQELDGAIVQVSWMVTAEGYPFTRIARTKEELAPTGSYKQRRLFEKLDQFLKDRAKRG